MQPGLVDGSEPGFRATWLVIAIRCRKGYIAEMKTATFLAFLVAGMAEAQTPATSQAELFKLEDVWNTAHLKGDAEALDGLWDADLVVTVPRMQHIPRTAALSLTRSGRFKFDKYETTEVTARIYGETGIVEGRLHRVRRLNDAPIEDNWFFTKVYVRRQGQWKVVSFHASDAP